MSKQIIRLSWITHFILVCACCGHTAGVCVARVRSYLATNKRLHCVHVHTSIRPSTTHTHTHTVNGQTRAEMVLFMQYVDISVLEFKYCQNSHIVCSIHLILFLHRSFILWLRENNKNDLYNFVILFFLCLISDLRRRRQLASHAHSQRRVASITPSVFDRWSRQHQTTNQCFLLCLYGCFIGSSQ